MSLRPSAVTRDHFNSYLGLMRLATVMMSLRLAGALTFAPEPIVIATSFSVRVWQICRREFRGVSSTHGFSNKMDQDADWCVVHLKDGDAVRDQSSAREKKKKSFVTLKYTLRNKSKFMLDTPWTQPSVLLCPFNLCIFQLYWKPTIMDLQNRTSAGLVLVDSTAG